MGWDPGQNEKATGQSQVGSRIHLCLLPDSCWNVTSCIMLAFLHLPCWEERDCIPSNHEPNILHRCLVSAIRNVTSTVGFGQGPGWQMGEDVRVVTEDFQNPCLAKPWHKWCSTKWSSYWSQLNHRLLLTQVGWFNLENGSGMTSLEPILWLAACPPVPPTHTPLRPLCSFHLFYESYTSGKCQETQISFKSTPIPKVQGNLKCFLSGDISKEWLVKTWWVIMCHVNSKTWLS